MAINANTSYSGAAITLTNEGTLTVAEGKQLSATGGASVSDGTGGKIAATGNGALLVQAGTFTEGQGTTSGTLPVIVDDGTLVYQAGGGTSLIALRGTSALSGSASLGQSLAIQSTCSENANTTAATGFSNGGTISLTNGESCATNVSLSASEPGLSNKGLLVVEPEHGGSPRLPAA